MRYVVAVGNHSKNSFLQNKQGYNRILTNYTPNNAHCKEFLGTHKNNMNLIEYFEVPNVSA